MATYTTLQKGSTGDSVKELQQALNAAGYNLSTDGVYGSKTAAAVKDYQTKNNLEADGVTTDQIWDSLYAGGNTGGGTAVATGLTVRAPSADTTASLKTAESNKPTYSPSTELQSISERLSGLENSKPGEYKSKYQEQIDGLLDKIMNREKFSYNFDEDPLYQQYKDRYVQQGQLAMQDSMAQAAALSGGYANSYAQSVGQQTYQNYLQGLNDIIPELRSQAYDMYQDEGSNMRSDLSTLQGLEDTDYGRYRDTVSDYWTELQYFQNKYGDQRDFDFNKYSSDLSAWQNDRAYWYQKYYDETQYEQWLAQFMANYGDLTGTSGSSGGGSSRGGSGSSSSGKSSGSGSGSGSRKSSPTNGDDDTGTYEPISDLEYISNLEKLAQTGSGQEYRMKLLAMQDAANKAKSSSSSSSSSKSSGSSGTTTLKKNNLKQISKKL